MGSWWEYDFSVVGKAELVDEVKEEITAKPPEGEKPYFHDLHIVHEATGFLVVHASRNYGGCDPLLGLADKYPDLAFAGKVEHEQQCVDGTYYIVGAHGGYEYAHRMEYDDFDPNPDNWHTVTAEDEQRYAADYDRRILWLVRRRDICCERFPDAVPDIIDVIKARPGPHDHLVSMRSDDSPMPKSPEEVRAIIEKIKARSGDKVGTRQGSEGQ
jgi:hypothetical protein